MSELEKMHIADIIDITNVFLDEQSLLEIWKDEEEIADIPENKSGYKALLRDTQLAKRILGDQLELYTFLLNHDREIDRFKFLMEVLINYKETLSMAGGMQLKPEEVETMKKGIAGIKQLLKGIDKTRVRYNLSHDEERITHLTIINSKEEVEGKDRKLKNSNRKRLKKLEKDEDFINIIQSIFTSDIEYIVAFEQEIGSDLRYMAEYNAIMKEYRGRLDELDLTMPVYQIAAKLDRIKFVEEIADTLEKHIEEINMDKLLLCSAYRYVEGLQEGWIRKDAAKEVKKRLEIIKKHIEKNPQIILYPDISYTLRDLERDLERFVGKGENVKYMSREEADELKEGLLKGEITLNSLGAENFKAIVLDRETLAELLKDNPNNYIFFLRQPKCQYSKDTILKDILDSHKCSTDLLTLLAEKTDITPEEIRKLFDEEIILAGDLKSVRELVGTIITNESLYEQYAQYKANQEQEEARTQLERYALAYRNTEILGKSPEEIQAQAEEFIVGMEKELEPSDLVQLYGLSIIPLKTAVDWGGEDIIEELLQSGRLKPTDAKHLRDEGLLDEKVIERLFKKCKSMVYSDQVALVSAVFDGQTQEDEDIKERLAQYYNIESGMTGYKEGTGKGRKRNSKRDQSEDIPKRKIKMRDPGAKYNFLSAIDPDVTLETGIVDGHIIFHYPNIDEGTVLIEKLHKIRFNPKSGLIEIKADNQSATYVLSEEEFIKMKSILIKDGKIDRTQLTQRWWAQRDPKHWIPHNGIDCWERAIMERFDITEQNSRYSLEDLKRIEELREKSIDSKKRDERDN